jgi:hypothetical protein
LRGRDLLLLLAVLAAIGLWDYAHRPLSHPPGVLAGEAPLQQPVDSAVAGWSKGEIALKPLAKFALSARVLGRANYRWDTEAQLVPTDLALGWGRMSDSAVLDNVEISQSTRFYFWRVREFPIPEREIVESSANMHLIPADRDVERAIGRTRVGDVVRLDGYLVEANWPNGYTWTSSLTRSDSGAGACELIWVEHFEIAPR